MCTRNYKLAIYIKLLATANIPAYMMSTWPTYRSTGTSPTRTPNCSQLYEPKPKLKKEGFTRPGVQPTVKSNILSTKKTKTLKLFTRYHRSLKKKSREHQKLVKTNISFPIFSTVKFSSL